MNLLRKIIKINFNFPIIWYHVKQKLVSRLIKMASHYGLYVTGLPKAESLYRHLTSNDVSMKESELKKITSYLKRAEDQKLYSEILQQFVPQLSMDFDSSQFTGRGYSKTCLNVYRKLIYSEDVLFEKVYFNSSHDLLRVKWFYENISPLMSSNIKTPQLYNSISGELITVVYFKFVDLVTLAMNDVSANVFNHSKELYKLSFNSNVKDKIKDAPEFLKDYKDHFLYRLNIEKASLKAFEFRDESFRLQEIEQRIANSHHVLTHGDIHWGNVYEDNYLIDWDSFGIYPIGLDVAFLLYQLNQCKLNYIELSGILEKEYRPIILKEDWYDFELNCLFFYFVFIVEPLGNSKMDLTEIQSSILDRIEELLTN